MVIRPRTSHLTLLEGFNEIATLQHGPISQRGRLFTLIRSWLYLDAWTWASDCRVRT